MDPRILETLDSFASVTLDQLNDRAAMLKRLDHKYIIPAGSFHPALTALADAFDVLEIDGQRAFTYATTYYDDPALRSYFDHHQGRRKRCKVRVRDYLDAGLRYLEVKLKGTRDVTVKKRLKLRGTGTGPAIGPAAGLDAECLAFIEDCHQTLYGEPFARPLARVISMEYRRITLVARDGDERLTIDTALQFHAAGVQRAVRPDRVIVETKSARGNGIADKILRGLHLHPTPRCSKYCIGLAATGLVERRNRFLPALRRLDLLTPAQGG